MESTVNKEATATVQLCNGQMPGQKKEGTPKTEEDTNKTWQLLEEICERMN